VVSDQWPAAGRQQTVETVQPKPPNCLWIFGAEFCRLGGGGSGYKGKFGAIWNLIRPVLSDLYMSPI